MELSYYKKGDALIIDFVGELDHHSSEEIRAKVDDIIDREQGKKVILDFYNVTFMDSSGIGAIVGRYKNVKRKGGTLCIINLRKGVQKVFEVAGLYKLIETYEDLEEALRAI